MMKNFMKNNNEISQNYVNMLGIKVLSITTPSLLTSIREKISHNMKFSIMTPNPELVLNSMKNPILAQALNCSGFAIPDGVGINYASKFLYGKPLNIIHGRILFEKLIELANKKGWKVFFLGGYGLEAQTAAEKLRLSHKKIKIEAFAGPKLYKNGSPISDLDESLQKDAIDRINKFSPRLLFVAFGNPKQEIWIHKNLRYLNIGGAMAVGGTFRYFAGLSKLPPKWMERWGLEWLWRFITEPHRVGRVLNASVIFPLKVFWFKITSR
jgi:N-acetylglucosaminyldiphosphoundecaprenol N-acetyl-beta-D-mannosaminyltransferase